MEEGEPVGSGEHVHEGAFEHALVTLDETTLLRGRPGEPRPRAHGREIARSDHGGSRDLVVHFAEEARVIPLLNGGGGIGRSGREADEERVAARLLDFRAQEVEDQRPMIEEVMALVEDDGAHARADEPVDEGQRPRVQGLLENPRIEGAEVLPDRVRP